MKSDERNNLGRGLTSFISGENLAEFIQPQSNNKKATNDKSREVIFMQIDEILTNGDQPRKVFDAEPLKELAESIKRRGIISPIIVRKMYAYQGRYGIIAGERRFRAAQIAGLQEIPVIVREATDTDVLEIALIENLQREDLNVVEEAKAYQDLMIRHDHSQEDLAQVVGKSRSYVANVLRLLTLPDSILEQLGSSKINAGHARALVGLDVTKAEELANAIVVEGLNVRQVEERVKDSRNQEAAQRGEVDHLKIDLKEIEKLLASKLQTQVKITAKTKNSGNITISYKSLEELDHMLHLLSK